MSVNVALLVLI